MQYTPPLRLFLVISVSFFLLVSFYTSIRSMEGILSANHEISGEEVSASTDDEEDPLAPTLAFVESINLPFFDEQTNTNLRRAMSAQAETNINSMIEDPSEFFRGYLEYITVFILLMIPLLALIQKLIYIRSGHFYVEHLVLTLHNHAFIISIVFVNSLIDLVNGSRIPIISSAFGYLGAAIYIWMWVYLFLSLKNYFQQGYGITLLKYLTTTILYGFTLGFGVTVFAGILFFLF
tara:strand:- start:1606 stop:2310 length:705 start_codon:yes stop_codon:yes gene_type:complete